MSDSQIYEMLWDCQFCGAKKNLGVTHGFCPNCGAPQNPDSRYYPSDDEKVAVTDHVFVGVDVTCPSCNELNSAAAEFCGQCGSPLTEGARARRLEAQSRTEGEVFESSGSRDIVKEKFDTQIQSFAPQAKTKKKSAGNNFALFAIIGIVITAIIGAIVAFTWTNEATLIVTDHQWERVINIQEYDSFRTDSWRDSRPSGDNVSIVPGSCHEEQRSTRRIPDGETCRTVRTDNGDGTFSERQECTTNYREEPVYDDMCTWSGFRWESINPVEASAASSLNAYWPEVDLLDCGNSLRVGCQRETGRSETYWVIFENTDTGAEHRCAIPQGEWASISVESLWTAQARVVGGTIICDSLQPK